MKKIINGWSYDIETAKLVFFNRRVDGRSLFLDDSGYYFFLSNSDEINPITQVEAVAWLEKYADAHTIHEHTVWCGNSEKLDLYSKHFYGLDYAGTYFLEIKE